VKERPLRTIEPRRIDQAAQAAWKQAKDRKRIHGPCPRAADGLCVTASTAETCGAECHLADLPISTIGRDRVILIPGFRLAPIVRSDGLVPPMFKEGFRPTNRNEGDAWLHTMRVYLLVAEPPLDDDDGAPSALLRGIRGRRSDADVPL
jgi:hypothetical protein